MFKLYGDIHGFARGWLIRLDRYKMYVHEVVGVSGVWIQDVQWVARSSPNLNWLFLICDYVDKIGTFCLRDRLLMVMRFEIVICPGD
jgi:hypothetical protein